MSAGTTRHEPRPLSESSSDSEDSRGEGEDWSDAEEDEEETQEVISLLDDRVFPDVMSMLAHCREKYGFDFLGVRQRLQLDFHGCVKLVNFSEFFAPLLPSHTSSLTLPPSPSAGARRPPRDRRYLMDLH